jgi:hypothetical protein
METYYEMSYEDFKETLNVMSEDYECEIAFIPEPEMMKAVLGFTEVNDAVSVVYSVDKIIQVLMERDGMTDEEAIDFYHYNIERGAMYSKANCLFVY